MILCFFFFFFFSSRRRHTRLTCDWSSDVCSSDLFPGVPEILRRKFERIKEMFREAPFYLREVYLRADEGQIAAILHHVLEDFPDLLLGSYPYFDNPIYSIKLTLESKDTAYLDRAHRLLLDELARIQLT